MTAIFYDRKNNREVSNSELIPINYVVDLMTAENGEFELKRGEFGYKSDYCTQYVNWDLTCNYTDLVFIRFE